MTKKDQDVEMWSGTHRDITFTVLDGDGASKSLTGASVTWQLSETPTSGSLVKRSTDSGCGIAATGCTFTVSLSPAHTEGLEGYYYHEAMVRDAASVEDVVAIGMVLIHPDAI